ncbi:MAG: type 1 glutamine amidotransferase domain-containing protein, partial [bacterium]|nr:type 1 glutamine amidotransferase domain-containing protein [bacterium]
QVRSEDYDAVYYPGGHGPMWDLADNKALAAFTREIYEKNGVVSAVCHGVAGLLPVTLSNGKLLLEGKKVTGFSNMEERLVQKDKWVPFLLETALREKAEKYAKHLLPGFSHVVVDGRVVTGQNPNSTKRVALETLKLLKT